MNERSRETLRMRLGKIPTKYLVRLPLILTLQAAVFFFHRVVLTCRAWRDQLELKFSIYKLLRDLVAGIREELIRFGHFQYSSIMNMCDLV